MEYKIGSFNVKNLNYSTEKIGNKAITRSFRTIADIIKKEDFAVVALQEVLSNGAMEQIMRNLGGNNWKFSWEQPPPKVAGDKADKRGEGYAYIWDSNKLDLVSIDVDNDIRKHMPSIWNQYAKKGQALARAPYYARFSPVKKTGGCFCEIRLINTHIVYGDKNTDGITLRKEEFLKVVKNVYQNIANKRYGNNMPAYVIVLGDYNLSLDQIKDLQGETRIQIGNSVEARKEEVVITKQEELTTVNHIKQENETYTSDYVSNYDHFSFIARYEEIMNIAIERIDNQKYCKNLVEYWETVSDHVPIKMSIDLNKRNFRR